MAEVANVEREKSKKVRTRTNAKNGGEKIGSIKVGKPVEETRRYINEYGSVEMDVFQQRVNSCGERRGTLAINCVRMNFIRT